MKIVNITTPPTSIEQTAIEHYIAGKLLPGLDVAFESAIDEQALIVWIPLDDFGMVDISPGRVGTISYIRGIIQRHFFETRQALASVEMALDASTERYGLRVVIDVAGRIRVPEHKCRFGQWQPHSRGNIATYRLTCLECGKVFSESDVPTPVGHLIVRLDWGES